MLESLEEDGFGYWLAGFLDGEAHLAARIEPAGGVTTLIYVRLRDDDAAVLKQIQSRTGCGIIRPIKSKAGSKRANPSVRWDVGRKADCLYMAHVLQRFKGFARKTVKEADLWIELVGLRSRRRGTPERGGWERAIEIVEQLRLARRYDASIYVTRRTEAGVLDSAFQEADPKEMTIRCERGEHQWEYSLKGGRPPRNCPKHRIPTHNRIWCELGNHWWERERGQGRYPVNCPTHLETKQQRKARRALLAAEDQ